MNEAAVGGACRIKGEMRSAYNMLIAVSEGKRPLGRTRCKM
jgi:hypothetical protein